MTLLLGCSTTANNTIATFKQTALGNSDVVMTAEAVEKLPYASAYIRVGDNPQAFVVLAYADKNGDLSWMSANKKLFVTRAGRIIKTIGLDNDLESISSATQDPLAGSGMSAPVSWRFQAEWKKEYVSGYVLLSRIEKVEQTTLPILDKNYDALLMEETIVVEHSNESWKNHYWIDQHTGSVLKSEQQLGPNLPVIEITILKPYTQ